MSVIQNLIYNYDNFKIEIPLWEISDLGITALKGSSGSGKSSVIRLLLGLDECNSYSWILNGVDLAQLPIGERRLGVVFQNYSLFDHLTARENIEFAATARKIPSDESKKILTHMMQALNLSQILDQRAATLSGGERQRVALARALIGKPQFLFLDEPFSALDSNLRAEARALVRRVIQEFSIPTLLVSHDADDIAALASQVVEIENGRLK